MSSFVLPDGSVLTAIPPNYPTTRIVDELYRQRTYEFARSLKQGMTVLDVGASIGVFTLKAAKTVGEAGQVIAVEPDPESYAALLENLTANDIHNVDALNLAAWNSYALLKLNLTREPTGRSFFKPTAKSVQIPTEPLDDALDNLGVYHLDFVKIDVEGAAMQTLEGLRYHLQETDYVVVAAYHRHEGEHAKAIMEYLRDQGFTVSVHGQFFIFVPFIYALRGTPSEV